MLDTDTKRRIDTSRDILVGKVPDPKSQVEQITIALIYKFMDDMDAESEEFGGKRKFFAGEFARYSWAKLMRSGQGGHEILNLYAEAIAKMPENPGIPLLFREIFKNAYLPYRDPETLRAFLKIIDEFAYDHSERLGDAYEYLLSVLGSQGDAGQFRTPRHIIDFIVAILDPKKTETVLDPACGTAGFLISSYKHILKANSSPEGIEPNGSKNGDETALHISKIPPAKGDLLTPDEKGRLATNFKGYDISPDMVRLSLVNLYLHGFTDPHIVEYDTLTSQDRWNEYADVILANPPFMSPKGGIKPHNRFSVQSKRSEVLFVDYMAEHLTPTGRAGIIIPEGIIFQSQTAYTQLRKMLVEEYLIAVISLPAGVFNPYSGVKTSILILDKSLAKKTNTIVFFKIENDGFGLGAQRRPHEKNDLPQVQAELITYLQTLRAKVSTDSLVLATGLIVPKEKIAANDDYNLSGDRHREGAASTSTFPIVELGEVVTLQRGYDLPKQAWIEGPHPIVGSNGIIGHHADWKESGPGVVTGRSGTIGKVHFIDAAHYWPHNTSLFVKDFKGNEPKFVKILLEAIDLKSLGEQTAAVPSLDRKNAHRVRVPLPPLEVQKQIVEEIEGYQKVIDGARAVLDNYRPKILIQPDWPLMELGEMLTLQRGYDLPKQKWENGPYPIVGSNGIIGFHAHYKEIGPGVVTGRSGTIGKVHFIDAEHYWPHNTSLFVKDFKGNEPMFVKFLLESIDLKSLGERTAAVPSLDRKNAYKVKVNLPPLAIQQQIVSEIEAEQALVASNRELIERFEKKKQITLTRIWGEEESP